MKNEAQGMTNENAPHWWSAQVIVRRAEREDIPALHELIAALADFEQLAPPDADAQERFARDGWPTDGQLPRFTAWLAYIHDTDTDVSTPAAYAITFETYSSFLARPTLYLEDIFVLQEFRRRAVGSALMQHLIQEARNRGCGRMEWVVLDWNTNAQEFYKRLGAQHLKEWHSYRLRL
jgi:GNAT superfamily N-acetyltransferase